MIATGLPAGPGAASGRIYFNAERAVAAAEKGEKVLLVRVETSPEDLRGMIAAEGILTARGGVSSHAALVARQMGKVCVCGAVDHFVSEISPKAKLLKHRALDRTRASGVFCIHPAIVGISCQFLPATCVPNSLL